ncbi:helix-turn-helix transcriptional regulator [Haloarcula salina]|uniref:ArsR family transcriptional regulator n=1 Tax=Haloarcula salina TaxID=1429914 RepID=A0AA41FZW6_9EURY|nr:ArsR family transcriptional regulator [Haloarcula salina]MBV0901039.1 ArsR family transcriptional regulator [Haloarcula salina]
MESALAEMEFLALSANRVDVLRLLSESAHTRGKLAAETGASQATLGRIIEDFEDRSWIRREGGAYVATATGRIVAEGVTDLLDILDTERDLRGIVRYLPSDAMDFDLRHLADATITTPSQTRPNAPLQRLLDLLRDAEDVRTFSHAFNDQTLEIVRERVSAGEQTFRGVFSPHAIEALAADDQLSGRLRRLLGEPDAAVRVRPAGVPLAVMVADDVVHLLLRDEDGVLRAALETTNPEVRAWAERSFERYWADADPVSDALSL